MRKCAALKHLHMGSPSPPTPAPAAAWPPHSPKPTPPPLHHSPKFAPLLLEPVHQSRQICKPPDPDAMNFAQQQAVLERLDAYIRAHDFQLWRPSRSRHRRRRLGPGLRPPYTMIIRPILMPTTRQNSHPRPARHVSTPLQTPIFPPQPSLMLCRVGGLPRRRRRFGTPCGIVPATNRSLRSFTSAPVKMPRPIIPYSLAGNRWIQIRPS